MDEVLYRLKLIKNEDFIWLIYFFIVLAALASNKYEKQYYLYNNKYAKKTAGNISSSILVIAFFIYLYYVFVNFKEIDILKKNYNTKKYRIAFENLVASILFLVAGFLSIYADYDNNNNGDTTLGVI